MFSRHCLSGQQLRSRQMQVSLIFLLAHLLRLYIHFFKVIFNQFFFWQWFVFLCILFINVCLFFCTNFLFSFLFCFSLSVSLSRMRAGRWAKGEGLGLGQSGRLFLFFLFQKRSISERKTPKKWSLTPFRFTQRNVPLGYCHHWL